MKIGKKLVLNAGIILFLMIVIGAVSVLGITYIQVKVQDLTQKSTPYQIKVFNHQRALQAHAANLLKTSGSGSPEEFGQNAATARESLNEELKSSEELRKLSGKGESSDRDITTITKSIIEATEKRLQTQQSAHASIESMRKNLTEASKRLNALDAAIRKLQQSATGQMVQNIENTTAVRRQTINITVIRDGFKDLIINITQLMNLNDRRSLVGIKGAIEGTAEKVIKAIKESRWSSKTGEDLEKRTRDTSQKLAGAVNLKLKYLKEEDESLLPRIEKIGKDAEYEISYMMPSLQQEFERANSQLKASTQEMAVSVNSFTGTNNVLITASSLISLNAFIESNINYSLSIINIDEFDRTISVIRNAFNDAEKTNKRLNDQTANFGDAGKLSVTSAATLSSVKKDFLGRDGAAEKIRASLQNVEEVAKLNQKIKEIAAQQILETSREVASARTSQENAVAAVRNAVRTNILVIIIIAVIAVLVSACLNRWIGKSILLSIGELTAMAEGFGNGDFNFKLNEDRKDEFGKLAYHFNQATGKLGEIVQRLTETIKRLSSSSGSLAATSEELAKVARDQHAQTEQSATATAQISKTVVGVAKNASEAADASKDAHDRAETGKDIVVKTVGGMHEIAGSVREAAETITKLSGSSEKIGAIVKTITEIADQTNLLALNAAIEAARAGDRGRGFAVVADEVRKLAERTGTATQEIAGIIHEIHTDTYKSVDAMNNGKAKVDEGVKLAQEASRSLEEIFQASQRGLDMAQMIAVATGQQSSAAEHVAESMENIKLITKHLEQSTTSVQKESKDLSELAGFLAAIAAWFKTNGATSH